MADVMITCPKCDEVQSSTNYLCARCGTSLESAEQHGARLHDLEMSRREAERNDVSITGITGRVNGTSRASFFSQQFFSEMSHQMRRRYAYTFASMAALALVVIIAANAR